MIVLSEMGDNVTLQLTKNIFDTGHESIEGVKSIMRVYRVTKHLLQHIKEPYNK